MPMLQNFGRLLMYLAKTAGPPTIKVIGWLGGTGLKTFIAALGYGLDAVRILATGLLQLGRGALTAFGWIIHAAATAFGWVPGIGKKLKSADKAFSDFKDNANAQLSQIERNINLNVDTRAAEQTLANWHPAITAYFNPPTVRPGVSSAAAIAAAGGGRATLFSNTNVNVNGKTIATATNRANLSLRAWR
jgi:hypothetical protein